MNLPNYFLADLPPEATVNPSMILEACQTLKRNREQFLTPRSTAHLIHVLSDVARQWLREDYPFRRLALQCGPDTTGFPRGTLAHGLDAFFGELKHESLLALVEQDLGHPHRL